MASCAHHVKGSPYKTLPELFLPEISDKSSDHEKICLRLSLNFMEKFLPRWMDLDSLQSEWSVTAYPTQGPSVRFWLSPEEQSFQESILLAPEFTGAVHTDRTRTFWTKRHPEAKTWGLKGE